MCRRRERKTSFSKAVAPPGVLHPGRGALLFIFGRNEKIVLPSLLRSSQFGRAVRRILVATTTPALWLKHLQRPAVGLGKAHLVFIGIVARNRDPKLFLDLLGAFPLSDHALQLGDQLIAERAAMAKTLGGLLAGSERAAEREEFVHGAEAILGGQFQDGFATLVLDLFAGVFALSEQAVDVRIQLFELCVDVGQTVRLERGGSNDCPGGFGGRSRGRVGIHICVWIWVCFG